MTQGEELVMIRGGARGFTVYCFEAIFLIVYCFTRKYFTVYCFKDSGKFLLFIVLDKRNAQN